MECFNGMMLENAEVTNNLIYTSQHPVIVCDLNVWRMQNCEIIHMNLEFVGYLLKLVLYAKHRKHVFASC